MLYSSKLLRLWRNRWLETFNWSHLPLSWQNDYRSSEKTIWWLCPVLIQWKKGNCQQLIIPISNAKLLLIIPVVINSTNVVIVIKYQIVVNNTSSIYTKIKFRSFFLGYSPNGNCVITLFDKLTKWITQL